MFDLKKFAAGATVNPIPGKSSDLTTDVSSILTNIIMALGIAAVVVMIIGGVQYMTSAGDATKVEKGKKTIIYGLIGLVICALAFVIVNFVIASILGNSAAQNNG